MGARKKSKLPRKVLIAMKHFFEHFNKSAPGTILGVLVAGLAINVIYDLLVRPGISTLTRTILDIVSFGSTTILDQTYAAAALDPRPVTTLMVLAMLASLLTIPFSFRIGQSIARRMNHQKTLLPEQSSALAIDAQLDKTEKQLKKFVRHSLLGTTIATLILFALLLFHSQSIRIWRIFDTNIRIITPYITELERNMLISKFALMKSKADYEIINAQQNSFAKRSGIELTTYKTW